MAAPHLDTYIRLWSDAHPRPNRLRTVSACIWITNERVGLCGLYLSARERLQAFGERAYWTIAGSRAG